MKNDKPTLDERDKNWVINQYKNRIQKYGLTVDSMKSGGQIKQDTRHLTHLQIADLSGKIILDVGCGLGQFYEFLMNYKIEIEKYIGIDIVPEYIHHLKNKYPNITVHNIDIFEGEININFDFAFISQVFNNKYSFSNNKKIIMEAIKRLFEKSNLGLSVDMMSIYVDYKDDDLEYFDPGDMIRFARNLTKKVVIRHDYLPYEFMMYMYKE